MHTTPTLRPLFRSEAAPLEATRERALLIAARDGDHAAETELVSSHLRLVRSIARRLTPAPSEDVIAEGVVGLLEAIRRFDCTRDCRLATYAAHWIRARVQRFVLANRGIVGSPDTRASRRVFGRLGRAERALSGRASAPSIDDLAKEIGVAPSEVELVLASIRRRDVPIDGTSDELAPAVCVETPEDRFGDAEVALARRRVIDDVLRALPDRERWVVQARALSDETATLDQLATRLALSRERVRQLEQRALRRIGDALVVEGLAA